jgi:hypothetical protein
MSKDINDRDIVLGEEDRSTTLLFHDVVRLQRVLWTLHGKEAPVKEQDLDDVFCLSQHVLTFLKQGRPYELAGLKDVPRPFLKAPGRFMVKSKTGEDYEELPDEQAKDLIRAKLFQAFQEDDLKAIITESPYREFKEILDRKVEEVSVIVPVAKDAILFRVVDDTLNSHDAKVYEQQGANKVIFNLASTLVTTYASNPEKRVEAALMILKGLEDAELPSIEDKDGSRNARFLVRRHQIDETVTWERVPPTDAAEFAVAFVYEVFLEKELNIAQAAENSEVVPASKSPVKDPTLYDVLFGRGGMTNSHPGNRYVTFCNSR